MCIRDSYNSVSANLSLVDASQSELFQAKASERESGGLLLQTGQILEGITDLYLHSSDLTFARLADRLSESLLSKLPTGKYLSDSNFDVRIDSTNKTNIGNNFEKVCVSGTPGSLAFLLVNNKKTNLREVTSGRYCGSYYNLGSDLEVELKNPYGISKRSKL